MTIRVYDNRIEFNNYMLAITPTGLSVNSNGTNTTATFTAASFDYSASPFQGTNSGYTSGGWAPAYNVIDKFRFSNINNAIDVGDLTQARLLVAGQSSSISGYTSGGYVPPATRSNVIDKFPFAQNANATDVGDLSTARYANGGNSSNTSGYIAGGFAVPGAVTTIDKFPFANDINASAVGNLTQARTYGAGHSSLTHGYIAGGSTAASAPTQVNTIDKFPFASDGTATDVGDIVSSRGLIAGISSSNWGYVVGGGWLSTNSRLIERFSFITDRNSVSVSDVAMPFGRYGVSGTSSESSGFFSGGFTSPPQTAQNAIELFPFGTFASRGFITDIGDLTVARGYAAGQQD
jgi:hypothetical protein